MLKKIASFFKKTKKYEEYVKECEVKGIEAKSKDEYDKNPETKCL